MMNCSLTMSTAFGVVCMITIVCVAVEMVLRVAIGVATVCGLCTANLRDIRDENVTCLVWGIGTMCIIAIEVATMCANIYGWPIMCSIVCSMTTAIFCLGIVRVWFERLHYENMRQRHVIYHMHQKLVRVQKMHKELVRVQKALKKHARN